MLKKNKVTHLEIQNETSKIRTSLKGGASPVDKSALITLGDRCVRKGSMLISSMVHFHQRISQERERIFEKQAKLLQTKLKKTKKIKLAKKLEVKTALKKSYREVVEDVKTTNKNFILRRNLV